jgi:hypothetical protein
LKRGKNKILGGDKEMGKRKKIFSLSVLVLCIAVFGLVGAVSAEDPDVPTILNDRYGVGNWMGPLSQTEISFTQTSSVVLVYVDDHVAGYADPTGWYETDSSTKWELFAAPVKGAKTSFDPGEEFGIYIDSEDGTFYSQNSKNPGGNIHAQLYQVTGRDHSGAYVVAFEDLLPFHSDYDYNDVVLELTNVNPIPEFATIALPVASVLGLLFFFNHRKRKKE